ncbi:MAG: lactate racemase domain-containing protein [Candidatus Bipolaricaulota bacterium]
MANTEQNLTLQSSIWYKPETTTISFPDAWKVQIAHMAGHEKQKLAEDDLRSKILNQPIGAKTITEEASGADDAVILFDDLTRPTRTSRIVPVVLDQLHQAGVADDSIGFVMAQGAHRAHMRYDYEQKLGKSIIQQYPVYSHNPFQTGLRLGYTDSGTLVEINPEVMNYDFKIGIGGIIPHAQMGYGGGGKIILPGVASIETIRQNHYLSINPQGKTRENAGWGCYRSNEHRKDVEQAARMANLDYKIDAFLNYQGEMVDIFAGDPIEEHHQGSAEAKNHYKTTAGENAELVIANTCCKATEAGLAVQQAAKSLPETGGTLIIVENSRQGLAPHYLYGRWGCKEVGGIDWTPNNSLPEKVEKLIVYSKYVDKGQDWWFGPADQVEWMQDWDDIVEEVGADQKEVVIYPDATIQLIS